MVLSLLFSPFRTLLFLVIKSYLRELCALNARNKRVMRLNILLFKKDNKMHFCDCGKITAQYEMLRDERRKILILSSHCMQLATHTVYTLYNYYNVLKYITETLWCQIDCCI